VARISTFIGHCYLGDVVDAASVHPEVIEAVVESPLPARPNFVVPSFSFTRIVVPVFECVLFIIFSPSVGENSIAWDVIANTFDQAKVAPNFDLQESHNERSTDTL
jgi:hypothetical protein